MLNFTSFNMNVSSVNFNRSTVCDIRKTLENCSIFCLTVLAFGTVRSIVYSRLENRYWHEQIINCRQQQLSHAFLGVFIYSISFYLLSGPYGIVEGSGYKKHEVARKAECNIHKRSPDYRIIGV